MSQNPAHGLYYVDYESLKLVLQDSTSNEQLGILIQRHHDEAASTTLRVSPVATRFLTLLEGEISKVNDFVVQRMEAIMSSLEQLKQQTTSMTQVRMDALQTQAREVEADLVSVDRFIRLNLKGFRKITKKFDKVLRERSSVWLGARLQGEAFCQVRLEPAFILLSEIEANLRATKGVPQTTASASRKTEFVRDVQKFWVLAGDEAEVVVRILQHLPFYTPTAAKGSVSPTEVGQWVSSVYLDSPDFSCYSSRLLLAEGAQLVRLRCYSLAAEKASTVYVERKTHHEKWTGHRSIKERIPLAGSDVKDYLSGKAMDLNDKCTQLGMSSAEIAKSVKVGQEVQEMVTSLKLAPVVRTIYRRCAFQDDELATVRLTLDDQVQLLHEVAPAQTPFWCMPLSTGVEETKLRRFPHSILEIKVTDPEGKPLWIEELISSGLLHEIPKFSKYLTAAALHYRHSLTSIPDWFAQPSMQSVLFPPYATASHAPSAAEDIGLPPNGAGGGGSHRATVAPDIPPATAALEHRAATLSATRRSQPSKRPSYVHRMGQRLVPVPKGQALINRAVRTDPKILFANERTFIQWLSASMMMMSIGVALFEFKASQLESSADARALAGLPPKVVSISDYFAGLFICTMALCVMCYGLGIYMWRLIKIQRRDTTGYHTSFGPVLLVLVLVASMIVYIAFSLDALI